MPFINTTTNLSVSSEKKAALKAKLGSAIELLGKSENWLMLSFCDGADMYFKGDDSPAAFVDVSVFGKSTDAQCENMTKEICKIMQEELSLPSDRVYIKFSGTNQWGWNNMNF